mgnify:FL=1
MAVTPVWVDLKDQRPDALAHARAHAVCVMLTSPRARDRAQGRRMAREFGWLARPTPEEAARMEGLTK